MAESKNKAGKSKYTPEKICKLYEKARTFNTAVDLYDTVDANEDFYIGKQWEGLAAPGLSKPVFNFLKRVTSFVVASVSTDQLKLNVNLKSTAADKKASMQPEPVEQEILDPYGNVIGAELVMPEPEPKVTFAELPGVLSDEFDEIMERCSMNNMFREFSRDSVVRGDACMYFWYNEDARGDGFEDKGSIEAELVENTRVFFGNVNDRRVERQPYIMIEQRLMVEEARYIASLNGQPTADIKPEDDYGNYLQNQADDKVTAITLFWRDYGDAAIRAVQVTKDGQVLRPHWDTGLTRYPVVWFPWDYVANSYHGQALITGLIPNQILVNKLFAMCALSFNNTAFPKVVFDQTRIPQWDNRVGAAIGVQGDVEKLAHVLQSGQLPAGMLEFINAIINITKENMGATSVALGENTNTENTSAIIATQRASAVPMEINRQSLYNCIEDAGRIWIDMMAAYYGKRSVTINTKDPTTKEEFETIVEYDFSELRKAPVRIKLDVGASSYWSEIASQQTLDNLLQLGLIDRADYLDRLPRGTIPNTEGLIAKIAAQDAQAAQAAAMPAGPAPEGGIAQPALPPEAAPMPPQGQTILTV